MLAGDRGGLLVAALTLLVVLAVCFMCVGLFKAHHPAPPACVAREGFQQWAQYRPACSSPWLSDRYRRCLGQTTGVMPSIDDATISWAPCCGALGVPPPVSR